MRAAKVQASLRIRAVSPEPPLLAHTSSESRGTFRRKVRSLAPLNGWACAVKICHDGMLEDNSLDSAHLSLIESKALKASKYLFRYMDRVKRIWYLSPMRAAKVQASLRIHAVSPEPSLLAHTSSESRGTFRQKARSWPLWMAGHANSLDGAHITTEAVFKLSSTHLKHCSAMKNYHHHQPDSKIKDNTTSSGYKVY